MSTDRQSSYSLSMGWLGGVSDERRQALALEASEVTGASQTDVVLGFRELTSWAEALMWGSLAFGILGALSAPLLLNGPFVVVAQVAMLCSAFPVLLLIRKNMRRLLVLGHDGYAVLSKSLWPASSYKVTWSAPTFELLGERPSQANGEIIKLSQKEAEHLRSRMAARIADRPEANPDLEGLPFPGSSIGSHAHWFVT